MSVFQETQAAPDRMLPGPVNLLKVYLLRGTGAGKTTILALERVP